MKSMTIIDLPIAVTDYRGAVEWILDVAARGDRAYAVEAANTHVVALARHDAGFGQVMKRFDLILPDGMPLVWLINRRQQGEEKLRERVYGPTLMLEVLQATQGESRFRHFFLGGAESTLERLRQRFEERYPDATIAGMYSPPYGEWPAEETEAICRRIQESGANLIWVGLGCPKQECWIAQHQERLPPGVYFGIGAAFAFHAGEVRQAPSFLQKLGMEWFYRLMMEPKRLFRRYLVYNSLFLYYLWRQ